jgi:translocator protein
MNKKIQLALCLTGPLLIGAISGIATATGINSWFESLNKPFFNPPAYLFGPVWTFLYLLMGVSFYLILQSGEHLFRNKAIIIFMIQLGLNFAWSFLFFKYQLPGIAFIEIILIWMSILIMIRLFYKINRLAALLQIPYLLWVSFASVLNGAIWWLN